MRVQARAADRGGPHDDGLADQAARERIRVDLASTLFVEAGAGAGKTKSLVDRVVALVAAGVQMREIAAITFTEKAAAELRDRIRRAFESRAAVPDLDPAGRARFRTALEQVDVAAISTLHAFAQRILGEHPIEARLPPNVEVLDEVASEIEFEDRWRRFQDALLGSAELERSLLLAFAAEVRLNDLRHIARVFDDNWDLVGEEQRFPWPAEDPPPCDVDEFVARIEGLLARRTECRDGDDKLCQHLTNEIAPYLERLRGAPDEYEALRLLAEEKPRFSTNYGRKENWEDKVDVRAEMVAIGEDKSSHAYDVSQAALRRIAIELARFTLEAAEQRRARGRLEFHDLLVLARELLRGPNGPAVRQALRGRYRRLLLDEFQDTDPIQIDLAVLIASDDPAAADKPWWDVDVQPGRLFFVGDPKQSIYRFRRADIHLFLRARQVFGDPSPTSNSRTTPPVTLTTNFRTTPPVIAWVNHVFGQLIVPEEGSQPDYQPLGPSPTRTPPPAGPPVVVLGREEHGSELDADSLREREAEQVADAVLAAAAWKVARPHPDGTETWVDARLGDIAILLPARTSLPALERALEARHIPYRAEASSLVYSTREVRDLHSAVRALADPTDQLSLVTALRSPLFGCGDDDLFTYRVVAGGAWHIFVDPPAGLDPSHPVVAAMSYLRDLHREVPWLTPSELLDRIVRDLRLFELGYAHGRPRDLWRRLRFVIDQARAWSEAEGGTLREYLDWARMQASESARVAETILPETDDDSVRILTIHASKGLEFPITILSGMTTASRGRTNRVEVAFPPGEAVALKVGRKLTTPEFEKFKPIDEQMDFHERLRLLYVACTRAKDHLVVSLHRKARKTPQSQPAKWTNAELIASVSAEAPHQTDLLLSGGPPSDGQRQPGPHQPPSPPLLPLADWEAERAVKLSSSSVRRNLGASDVALAIADGATTDGGASEAELDDEVAAGAAKQPRDLELPPWQKGRYGTAVGRAVHAVLQTIDLATGEGLEQAAAAQAAAEGVIGHEAEIVRLARAALHSDVVKEALRHPRWRETYVATTIGDRTLEGYVDLLYRAPDGLVVVDYKTAGSAVDLATRVEHYRPQGGSYALAVEEATGEAVARVVFVFLTPAGATELELDDLPVAKALVRRLVGGGTS